VAGKEYEKEYKRTKGGAEAFGAAKEAAPPEISQEGGGSCFPEWE